MPLRATEVVRALVFASALKGGCAGAVACQCPFPIDGGTPGQTATGETLWTRGVNSMGVGMGCTPEELNTVVDGGRCRELYNPGGPLMPPDLAV